MTSQSRGRRAPQGIEQYPVFATINDAVGLAHRFIEAETFRAYVTHRLRLVVPMCCLILFVSVACAAAVMLALGEMHRSLVLVGVILLPLIVVGSALVQAYLFFSWLESRALAHRDGAGHVGGGQLPPVPWVLAGVVIFVPLALLAFVAWKAALVLVVVVALAPFLYASLDA